jgi:putative tricarboxylic transport membrane protein
VAGGLPPVGTTVGAPNVPAGAAGAANTAADAARHAAAERTASRSLRTADIVTASLLLGLGVLVLGDSIRMGIGWGSDGPQSGFVPFWLSAVLIFCCAIIIAHTARRASDKRFVTGEQLARVLKVLVPAAAMIALTPHLGLYVATVLYMAAYMRWAGRHSWKISIALPLSFALLIFLLFERWFLVPLPKGPLEAWLGY